MEPASVSHHLDAAGDPREKWVPCAESCVHTGSRTWQNLPPWATFRACQRKRGVNFRVPHPHLWKKQQSQRGTFILTLVCCVR